MANTILIKNIDSLITCDENENVFENINIFIENGVIKSIDNNIYDADEVIDGRHLYVYPGLINTHHHLYQTFTRNLPQVQKMELFPWLCTLYEIWKGIDSEVIYYSSLVGMGELLKGGCTTCFDHHYVFPQSAEDTLIDTQFDAASLSNASRI